MDQVIEIKMRIIVAIRVTLNAKNRQFVQLCCID